MAVPNAIQYRVFVSSTVIDLPEERQAARRAILRVGALPAGFESEAVADRDARDSIEAEIKASDYLVLLLGSRSGAAGLGGLSYSEIEYNLASKLGIPILIFVRAGSTSFGSVQRQSRLDSPFFARVTRDRLVTSFESAEELEMRLVDALQLAFRNSPQNGWRRISNITERGSFQGGLVEFLESFSGVSYKEMLAHDAALICVFNDGRGWVSAHLEALRERCRNSSAKTTFLFIHPDSDFMPVLIRKNGKSLRGQIEDLRRSVAVIQELAQLGGHVEVRGHFVFNPYSMVLGDEQAFVMPYFLNEAGALPVCVFQRDVSGNSLYWRYQRDATALLEKSVPITSSDFKQVPPTTASQPDIESPARTKSTTPRKARTSKQSALPNGTVRHTPNKCSGVFVSYSHLDKRWLEELKVSLKPHIREDGIDVWDDTRLRGGEKWREEITRAIENAKVAILLVSRFFFASDFIVRNELQPLLESAKHKGVTILWVAVSASAYERSPINQYQALNDPARPLEGLRKPQRSKALVQIAETIRQVVATT